MALIAIAGCGKNGDNSTSTSHQSQAANKRPAHPLPDTLRVATLYSPTSYFIYRDEEMGYDFSLVKELCKDKNMAIDLKVAPSMSAVMEMLDSGIVDLVACEVPIIAENRKRAIPCGPPTTTWQVLVQPKNSKKMVTNVTQLVGRDIYVEADSKYQSRLENLNEELGGGVKIHPINRDTLITEDLIEMVSKGEIPLTIVDSDIASINKTYYNDLDITMKLSFPQEAAWAVSPKSRWLADVIDEWFNQENHRASQAELLKKYFEKSKEDAVSGEYFNVDFSKGRISPYDDLFKKYAKSLDYDWRLLAAQGYAESRFDSTAVSWAGARGVMQIMPSVAGAYGLTPAEFNNPEASIKAAAKMIAELDKSLRKEVPDRDERRKFIVAAYNSGLGHIKDAIALAAKHDLDPTVWDNNVETALMWKSKPEYYNDPVCRCGYFRGRQTQEYVVKVMEFYNKCKDKIKP